MSSFYHSRGPRRTLRIPPSASGTRDFFDCLDETLRSLDLESQSKSCNQVDFGSVPVRLQPLRYRRAVSPARGSSCMQA
jgi:hypothetical protein